MIETLRIELNTKLDAELIALRLLPTNALRESQIKNILQYKDNLNNDEFVGILNLRMNLESRYNELRSMKRKSKEVKLEMHFLFEKLMK